MSRSFSARKEAWSRLAGTGVLARKERDLRAWQTRPGQKNMKRCNRLSAVFTPTLLLWAALAFTAFWSARADVNNCTVSNVCPDFREPPLCYDQCACAPGQSGPPDSQTGTSDMAPECSSCKFAGMPVWWVSQPLINVRVEDVPLWWISARGVPLSLHLSYRQRGSVDDSTVFGFGQNWSCSFRAYLVDLGGTPHLLRLHRGGAGWIDYNLGQTQSRDGSIVTTITGGYQIEYRDGAKDVFTHAVTGENTSYFLTSQQDSAGNTTTYAYSADANHVLLSTVTDPDSNVISLSYTNANFPYLVTSVTDPCSRVARFFYDDYGYLSSITDVGSLSSSFSYSGTWLASLTTPYGTTSFTYGGVDAGSSTVTSGGNLVNRYVKVTLPTGGTHLYVYRHTGTDILPGQYSPVPNTGPLANTFDNVDQTNRNSFHWDPRQYAILTNDVTLLTSNDYKLAHLSHWLLDLDTNTSQTLSLEREASPDGVADGQFTWYDAAGKTHGNNYVGTNVQTSFVARILPGGGTNFVYTPRNTHSQPTTSISTYTKTDGSVGLRTNVFTFAANDIDLLTVTNASGIQVLSNWVNASHQVLTNYDALGQMTVFTRNGYGQITHISRPTGLTTTNIYVSSGDNLNLNRLDTTIDLEISRTNSYSWANGLEYSRTDERGLTTTNYWDDLQRPVATVWPDGSSVSNFYSILDKTAVKDRMNFWSYAGYNANRQKISETNALGTVTRYGYCDCGAMTSRTNAWGTCAEQHIAYAYDYQGNRTYTFLPDATITNWFDSLRRVYLTGDGRALQYLFYNNQGLLTVRSNLLAAESKTVYDAEDRALWVTDANGVTVTNTFDSLGRTLSRLYPDGGQETFGYSARGLIAYTNQIGQSNFFAFDEASRKIYETNANNELIQYAYNPAGDLLTITDGKSQVTTWQVDEFGRVTNKLDQAGTIVLKYQYDQDNRLLSRWSAAKGTTYYTNDAAGNLTYIKYPASPSVSFKYDPLNRLTNMVDAVGTTKYTYTTGGQLLTEDGPFASDTVSNTYLNRLRTGLALGQPAGLWTNGFAFDSAGRLTNVTSQAGSFLYTYDAQHPAQVGRLSLPNGSAITNQFDSVARLLATHLRISSGLLTNKHEYTYNTAGQRTGETRTDGSTLAYAYDHIGQLRVADSSVNSEDRGYSYDAAWNLSRRTNNGAVSTFQVDGKNELTNAPPGTYSFDGNGNMVELNTYNIFLYGYDDENRLIGYGTLFNGPITDFAYDGLGRLRKRTEYTVYATNVTEYLYDGNRVIQERDGANNLLVSYTRGKDLSGTLEGAGGIGGLLARSHDFTLCTNVITVRITNNSPFTLTNITIHDLSQTYVSGGTVDPGGYADFSFSAVGGQDYMITGVGDPYYIQTFHTEFTADLEVYQLELDWDADNLEADLTSSESGNVLCGPDLTGNWLTHNYYHADGNGNVTFLETTNETLSARYRYDPFGNTISQSGGLADANVYRFSSKEIHVASGMYYYLYRFYDPNLQRWINRDPAEEAADINLYRLGNNCPVTWFDAWGLEEKPTNPISVFPPIVRQGPGFPWQTVDPPTSPSTNTVGSPKPPSLPPTGLGATTGTSSTSFCLVSTPSSSLPDWLKWFETPPAMFNTNNRVYVTFPGPAFTNNVRQGFGATVGVTIRFGPKPRQQ
jgi:RHS repeat-associated protein